MFLHETARVHFPCCPLGSNMEAKCAPPNGGVEAGQYLCDNNFALYVPCCGNLCLEKGDAKQDQWRPKTAGAAPSIKNIVHVNVQGLQDRCVAVWQDKRSCCLIVEHVTSPRNVASEPMQAKRGCVSSSADVVFEALGWPCSG